MAVRHPAPYFFCLRTRAESTRAIDYICPNCGKLLTIGVLNRVEELASRPKGGKPQKILPFYSIITLAEMLSEILDVGPKTKKVFNCYNSTIDTIGPELKILLVSSLDQIDKASMPLLTEAVSRMRRNEINISPGYDGEYGKIKVFKPGEKRS